MNIPKFLATLYAATQGMKDRRLIKHIKSSYQVLDALNVINLWNDFKINNSTQVSLQYKQSIIKQYPEMRAIVNDKLEEMQERADMGWLPPPPDSNKKMHAKKPELKPILATWKHQRTTRNAGSHMTASSTYTNQTTKRSNSRLSQIKNKYG